MFLMEEKKLFLIKGLSDHQIALLLKTNIRNLNRILNESLGMGMEKIISMYRIQHARELLIMGVNYKDLWKFSGFNSLSKMERAFEDVVVLKKITNFETLIGER